jgi:hypothetical protein
MMPTTRKRQRTVMLVLPLLLAASAACDIAMGQAGEQEVAEWRKTYDLTPGGRVEIGNVNGKIDVVSGQGNAVEIVARKSARAASKDAAVQTLGRIEIRESASADGIKVETHFERSAASLFSHANWQVQYTVRVPANAELKLSTVNGGVEITGVSGRITAEATNGGVRARDISGVIEASTTNGGVDVDLSKVAEGGATLECTNGGIRLRLPADAAASVSARVTNGGIDTGGLGFQMRGQSSQRRMDGDLNGGGPRITLEGTNGGITISSR